MNTMRSAPLNAAMRTDGEADSTLVTVSGLAIPWDTPTRLWGSVWEEFAAGSIDPDVAEKTDDAPYAARLNLGHVQHRAVASVDAGTLVFTDETREVDGEQVAGLFFDATVDTRDSDANDLVVKVERGDYSDASIEFSYGPGYREERVEEEDRVLYRVLETPKLYGVAVLAHGAYPTTSVDVERSADRRHEQERALREASRAAVKREMERSALRRRIMRAELT